MMKRRAALFVLAGALALVVAAGVALAATVECEVDDVVCVGTDGPDKLLGTDSRDEMDARQGDDVLRGFGGADLLRGDSIDNPDDPPDGNDQIYGGKGRDFLTGKGGSDLLKGNGGRDEIDVHDHFNLVTNPGEDTVFGGFGDDDVTRAEDGFKDTIDCGQGSEDRVLGYDEGLDEISSNCEIVFPGEA
jgi:Ca2+-binding RTX toxin-like protein